jgi:hypothetical protein
MAGDWIPMRCNLLDDPAVIAVAGSTGLDEYAVAGRLLKLWAWANQHTLDGNARCNAPGVTETWVDRYVAHPGFAAAMVAAGWLVREGSAVAFPKFDVWNSQAAKRRALTARRVAGHRAGGNADRNADRNAPCNAASVTAALPEKRREETKVEKTPLPPAKPGGGVRGPPTPDFEPGPEPDPGCGPETVPPFAELVAAWGSARLPGSEAPGGIQRTPQRVALWQARLRDPAWANRWAAAVVRAGRSARCRGAAGGWSLRLDTFLKNADVLVRILEGEFDDASGGGGAGAGAPRRDPGPGRYGHITHTAGARGAPPPGPGARRETGGAEVDLFDPG